MLLYLLGVSFSFSGVVGMGVSPTWMIWDSSLFMVQLLLIFYTLKLPLFNNFYQLLGFSSLWLTLGGVYLFFYQLDVFACFLLVSEYVILLFILSVLVHLNVTNLNVSLANVQVFWWCLGIGLYKVVFSGNMSYFIDWYRTVYSFFNDLITHFLFLYNEGWLLVLVGIWLLVLTFLLVWVTLLCFTAGLVYGKFRQSGVIYSRNTQLIWSQWFNNPVLRFFQ